MQSRIFQRGAQSGRFAVDRTRTESREHMHAPLQSRRVNDSLTIESSRAWSDAALAYEPTSLASLSLRRCEYRDVPLGLGALAPRRPFGPGLPTLPYRKRYHMGALPGLNPTLISYTIHKRDS